MSDVRLFQELDGGNIEHENGQAVMDDGLETAGYLSLFGGNEEDSGGDDTKAKTWWGNRSETEPEKQYRSETQFLLRALPLVPRNLRRFEDAAGRDLAWMVDAGITTFVGAVATIPKVNRLKLLVTLEIDGRKRTFQFTHDTQAPS